LVFGAGADGQQMGLPQLQAVGDDFQAVVEHAARVGMVMRLGGREGLDQLGVAFQGRAVQVANCLRDSEVRCQMCSSSFCRRGVASSDAADSGRISPFGRSVAGAGDGAAATGGRFRWNRESMRVSCGGPTGRPFGLFEVGPFPLHPIPLPFRPFGL
jgi:hypothetical protein